ncbi:hypothetical protein COY32_03025, partial [candidate division WWE3 bacterium CG_4_10_14_0_2_um_filter_41_14]
MANYFKAGGDRQGVVDLRKISRPKPSSDAKDKPRLAGAPSLTKSSAAEKFLKSSAGDYSRFKHSPKKGRQGILVFLIALLILLIGAAVAGFVFFGPKGGSADSVKVSLATAKSVASGEELGLELTYENIDQVPLKEIEVIFEYPEGFFFERSNLKPTG